MARVKVFMYQWYKKSDRGLVTINGAWFPEGMRPTGDYWVRDKTSKRRFKEVEAMSHD